jgi:glycine/D-amino acid oxidase-like deaminating enzyme
MAGGDSSDYGASWYESTMVAAPERGQLTFDLDVDVCVVGGGLAGLTVAREVARRRWSVALVEGRRIAWNASGRNDGFVIPGFGAGAEAIIERVGLPRAKALWALSEQGVSYVRRAIRDERMVGVNPVSGWLNVAKFEDDPNLSAAVDLLRDGLGAEVEEWSTEQVRSVLKSPLYFRAIHFPAAFHIHPLNYALGLAEAAERDGARLFERTPALSLDPAGVRKRVVTPAARVRAAHVVLAGNVHLGGLAPRVAATLLPITSFVAATAPLGERLAEAVTYRGGVSDTTRADNHYRIVEQDRLAWSGGMRAWAANPRRFAHRLQADIGRIYPQLGEVEITQVWSGTLGRALHRMPQIGELSPGLWIASGFGGHGLNTTAMAGELIARAIVEGDQTWRQFAGYDLVWAGGVFARAAAQSLYWASRLADLLRARRAWSRSKETRREPQTAAIPAGDIPALAGPEAEKVPPREPEVAPPEINDDTSTGAPRGKRGRTKKKRARAKPAGPVPSLRETDTGPKDTGESALEDEPTERAV